MNIDKDPQLPVMGQAIKTACGTKEKFMENTPRVLHEGRWLFFCIPSCQEEFIQDPENSSCLAGHPSDEGK
jgi:YHS domain-containing protein